VDPISLVVSIVSLVGSGLVWYFKSSPTKKVTGFAALLKGILELIDKLDDEDTAKASLATDVLSAVTTHTLPAAPDEKLRLLIREELRSLHEVIASGGGAPPV